MKREVVVTSDGSPTIRLPDWNEHYHSKHGAIQEAYHVYIQNGLSKILKKDISILEMGFGTGLNALITSIEAEKRVVYIDYHTVEAYPVTQDELKLLRYDIYLDSANSTKATFKKMHSCDWATPVNLSKHFTLTKWETSFENYKPNRQFDIIYYDAFGPRVQPHLWEKPIFQKLYDCCNKQGLLTTYCSKGTVRRILSSLGFEVIKVPGPPGKREMLMAIKP